MNINIYLDMIFHSSVKSLSVAKLICTASKTFYSFDCIWNSNNYLNGKYKFVF